MATVLIDGLNFYYELHGKGKPLVLIAGYTCDHSVWGLMIEELAQNFQVLIFDNRAVGQTTDDNLSINLEKMAEDALKLIHKLNLEKPHILGQSMGGAIAQHLARKYTRQIDKLIILNSTAQFNPRTRQLLHTLLTARAQEVNLDLLIELSLPWFFGNHFLENQQQCIEFKKNSLNYPFPQTIIDQERQLAALIPFDSSNWLTELRLPTLVISAKEDIICLHEESRHLAQGINQAQLVSVEGGHSSPIEAYRQVNQHIMNFLL